MTRNDAGRILGVDDDALADLEDILEVENWTVDDLKHAAEIVDGDDPDAEDLDEDEDEEEFDDD